MPLAPPLTLCASCHAQYGGGLGPSRPLSRFQVAPSTLVMAAPPQAAGCGALEICDLERILEALKLLLSPGGERTDLGAGLHRDSQGRLSSRDALAPTQCAPQALPGPGPFRPRELWPLFVQPQATLEETEPKGGMGSVAYYSNQRFSSAYLLPVTLLSALGTWFHSVLTAALCNGVVERASETVGTRDV